jgi:hypothetical protein
MTDELVIDPAIATREPKNSTLTPSERAAGRARVAELLGQLVFKHWLREQSGRKEDHNKPKK